MFTSCVIIMQWNGIWQYVKFWRLNFHQNLRESKRFSDRRLIKEYTNKNCKDKHWTTFCDGCTQPVRSNALQEAVGHGHSELQIGLPLPQFYTRSVEYSFLFPMVHSLKCKTHQEMRELYWQITRQVFMALDVEIGRERLTDGYKNS